MELGDALLLCFAGVVEVLGLCGRLSVIKVVFSRVVRFVLNRRDSTVRMEYWCVVDAFEMNRKTVSLR